MKSDHVGQSAAPEFASAFNLRKNWQHLTNRPAHQ
jgi:hypothetical protein